jgi:hypothetical protein
MFLFQKRNGCCGGWDVMAVAARGHAPVAMTSVSGLCGGYTPTPTDTGWKPSAVPERFWFPAYFVRRETKHGREWVRITEDAALRLAPELSLGSSGFPTAQSSEGNTK